MPAAQYTYEDPELWRQIKAYPEYYISTWGRIVRPNTGRLISTHPGGRNGALYATLRVDGKSVSKRVNKLMAVTFMGYIRDRTWPANITFVDGDPTNCHILNLKPTANRPIGGFLPGVQHLFIRQIVREDGVCYDSLTAIAEDMGVSRSQVYRVLNGVRNTLHGLGIDELWVEGSFDDGGRFVPWPNGRTRPVRDWQDPMW